MNYQNFNDVWHIRVNARCLIVITISHLTTNYHTQNSFRNSVLIFIFLLHARLKLWKVCYKKNGFLCFELLIFHYQFCSFGKCAFIPLCAFYLALYVWATETVLRNNLRRCNFSNLIL